MTRLLLAVLCALLLLAGCEPIHRLTDPERRMRRLAEKHPEVVARVFPADTVTIPHDTTIYLAGATDTLEITRLLFDTLDYGEPAVILLHDTASGLEVKAWKDKANHLRLQLSKQADSVRVEWKEKLVTRTGTVTVEVVPEGVEVALWVLGIFSALAIAALLVVWRKRKSPP